MCVSVCVLGQDLEAQLDQGSGQQCPERHTDDQQPQVGQLLQPRAQSHTEAHLHHQSQQIPELQPRVEPGPAAPRQPHGQHQQQSSIKHPDGQKHQEPAPADLSIQLQNQQDEEEEREEPGEQNPLGQRHLHRLPTQAEPEVSDHHHHHQHYHHHARDVTHRTVPPDHPSTLIRTGIKRLSSLSKHSELFFGFVGTRAVDCNCQSHRDSVSGFSGVSRMCGIPTSIETPISRPSFQELCNVLSSVISAEQAFLSHYERLKNAVRRAEVQRSCDLQRAPNSTVIHACARLRQSLYLRHTSLTSLAFNGRYYGFRYYSA